MYVLSSLEGNVYFEHVSLIYQVCSVLSFLLMKLKIGLDKIQKEIGFHQSIHENTTKIRCHKVITFHHLFVQAPSEKTFI